MKPAWDQLMGDFAGNPNALIADVDCDGTGKDLCETHGIEGFPTIKWGEASDMKKYEGGRTYEALKEFAENNLGPQCGPGENIHLCSDKVKAQIEKYLALGETALEAKMNKALEKVEIDMPFMNKAMAFVKVQEAGGPEALALREAAEAEKAAVLAGTWESEGTITEISLKGLKAKGKITTGGKKGPKTGSVFEGKVSGLTINWDLGGKTVSGTLKDDGLLHNSDGRIWTRQAEAETAKEEATEEEEL